MTGTVCTPLRSERAALAGRVTAHVTRSGRGPDGTARGALPGAGGPVLVTGVAGALRDDLKPGDLVVASEIRTGDATVPVHAAPLLAGALRRHGLHPHVGPVATRPRIADGSARTTLSDAGDGAVAVDTESGYLAAAALPGTTAVLRAIVDTPSAPLLRPGTALRGVRALRALRAAAPAIDDWASAAGDHEVLLAAPRSFCAGVERAIETVTRALERFGAPVYVRRQIVHNAHVVRDLERRGAVFVHEVGDVPAGSVLVLAAHGVAPQVRRDAADRGLRVIDATCPLVTKVHTEVRRFATRDSTVFLIGHPGHEEVVGTHGEAPGNVVLVSGPDEAREATARDPRNVSYVMQTTLAVDEAERTAAVLRERFPALEAPRKDDICYATTNRQQAVRAIARESDMVLVLGSENSSNSHRLAEVAEAEGARAHLVDDASHVDLRWLAGAPRVGITAGASAPPALVDELVQCLSGLGEVRVRELDVVEENVRFTLPREVS